LLESFDEREIKIKNGAALSANQVSMRIILIAQGKLHRLGAWCVPIDQTGITQRLDRSIHRRKVETW
jgi:hypothetical protein